MAQTVTVTGVDDTIVDGDVAYTIITAPALSTDPNYNGFDAPDVSVTNLDNDTNADPYTVTTTADSGAGSLRQAILNADAATSGPITITFQIPTSDPNFAGGVFVIQPAAALPAINNPNASIIIDGRTQSAFSGDTNPFGPEVVLDGTNAGSSNGLVIQSDGNEVHGLDIRKFSGDGIAISGGSDNWIAGNFLGTDATGTVVAGNTGSGVDLYNAASFNIIGTNGDGTDDANEGNLISGNFNAVSLQGTGVTENVVAGNLIGSDRTGTIALGQLSDNVWIVRGASNNRVGTNFDGVSDDLERNVIVGARYSGVAIFNDHTDGNVIAGNYIGVNATGTKAHRQRCRHPVRLHVRQHRRGRVPRSSAT